MATELGKAYVQIVPSAKGISGSIENALNGEADSAGASLGSKLMGSLKKVIVSAGIGAAIKKSLDFGAELQQNLGGTEAVFGNYANKIQNTATSAYKNMGLSASDYMATANKMGSLFQGSGVEQVRALELTQDAMQRAADVASVMGIDTTMAMESIAGAAKGNFTMMDNLGVAMNATTLEAYALEKGINFKWNTASNAEKAELAMKMFMDRTSQYAGNFAHESESTLSGSLGAMKAAYQDFMANLSLGQDIGPAMNNLVQTAVTYLGNLIPAIGNIFAGLPGAIKTGVDAIHPALMMGLAKAIVAVKKNAPKMIENALNGLMDFSATLRKNAGQIATSGLALIKTLADSIIKNIPVFIQTVPTIISNFAGIINDNAPKIMATGLSIIKSLGLGLIKAIPVLIQNIPLILKAIWDVFTAFQWLDLGKTLITGIKNGITAMGGAMKGAGESIANGLKSVFTNGWNVIKNITSTIWNAIKSVLSGNWNSIKNLASTVWGAIKGAVTNPIQSAKSLLSSLWSGIKSATSAVWNSIKSTASSVWAGIKSAMTAPIESAKTTIRNALNKIKGFFPLSVGKIFSNLKIPKISVSGGKAPFGIGGKGSLPSFSVHWNAQGGVYDSASIVGIGVGEAGREIVTPETLMRQIVNESNDRNYAVLLRILGVLTEVADSEKTLSINHREFARLVNEVI